VKNKIASYEVVGAFNVYAVDVLVITLLVVLLVMERNYRWRCDPRLR